MLTPLEEGLLGIMMILIMLGMGASLTFKDFRIALRQPQAIGIGFASQYLFMPLLAWAIGHALQLPPAQAVSLILMGCVPGGTTSNIFVYFSNSLLSLSILMTVCSTLAAVLMVPLVLGFYSYGIDGDFHIPAANIITVLLVLLIPTLLGMWSRKKNANFGAMTELVGGALGVVVIIFLTVTWAPRNWDLLRATAPEVYIAAVGLGLCGFVIGYWFSRGLRLDPRKARTVSLETGIQNGPLAVLIVTLSFTGELQQQMLLIPMLYSLFIIITSTFVTLYYRRRSRLEALARDQAKIEPVAAAKA